MALPDVFHLDEARRHGLTRAQLLGSQWQRLGPRVYGRREEADDPIIKLKAALLRLPCDAAFSGPTAAFLHGLDTRCAVIEATIPSPSPISRRVGIVVRRRRLASNEVVTRKGLPVTSPIRTVTDLVSRLDLVEAVVILDRAVHTGLIRLDEVPRHAEHVEPATESPMETRLRMALVMGGLPKPGVQVYLPDAQARADLYYPDVRLVIEYDGATHRDSLASDNRRQNRLTNAGYRILRFTAPDLAGDVAGTVRRAISAAAHAPSPAPA